MPVKEYCAADDAQSITRIFVGEESRMVHFNRLSYKSNTKNIWQREVAVSAYSFFRLAIQLITFFTRMFFMRRLNLYCGRIIRVERISSVS